MADDSTNDYAENLRAGLNRVRENKAAAAGEQLLKKDYARLAREQAPTELNALEEHLKARVEAATRTPELPQHAYNAASRHLYAGKFAVTLSTVSGLDSYQLDVAVGLHPNAAQFMDLNSAPEVNSVVWHLLAAADDNGFFWYDLQSHQRATSQEVACAALKHLAQLLLRDATR